VYLVTINFVASLLRNTDHSYLFYIEIPYSIDMVFDPLFYVCPLKQFLS